MRNINPNGRKTIHESIINYFLNQKLKIIYDYEFCGLRMVL